MNEIYSLKSESVSYLSIRPRISGKYDVGSGWLKTENVIRKIKKPVTRKHTGNRIILQWDYHHHHHDQRNIFSRHFHFLPFLSALTLRKNLSLGEKGLRKKEIFFFIRNYVHFCLRNSFVGCSGLLCGGSLFTWADFKHSRLPRLEGDEMRKKASKGGILGNRLLFSLCLSFARRPNSMKQG